jgi:hypothetical protein
MRTILVALLALVLTPSLAVAGGGMKQIGTVRVKNSGSNTLAVVIDPSTSLQNSLSGGTLDTQTFLKAGGQFVGPGGTATFGGVRAGSHNVAGAYVSGTSSGSTVGTADAATVSVQKGKTVNLSASGSTAAGATLTVQ